MCGVEVEDVAHALMKCTGVQKIWFVSPLGLRIDVDQVVMANNLLL